MTTEISKFEQMASKLMKNAFTRQATGVPGRSPEETAYLIGQAKIRGNTGPENSAAGFQAILSANELSAGERAILAPLIEERTVLGCLLDQMPPSLQKLNAHWRRGVFFRDVTTNAGMPPVGRGTYRVCNTPDMKFLN